MREMNEPFNVAPVVGQDRVWVCFETGWPCAAHVPNDPASPYAYPVHEYVRADLYAQAVAERDAAVARAERFRGALLEIALCLCNALKDPERARARRELGIKAPDAPCGLCGPCRAAEALAAEPSAPEDAT